MAAFGLAACLAACAACAHRRATDGMSNGDAVSVEVGSLWKKEAATDPIMAYRLKVAADPDNAALHNNLGNQYVIENRMKEALHEFRMASRLDRDSPVPWNNIGTTYKKLGSVARAKDAFQQAVQRDARYALGWYNLGTIYDEQGDYDRAIDLYLKALSLKPELGEVKFNPQVVNNRNLMVVKLRHYLEESGNIALPLDRLPE